MVAPSWYQRLAQSPTYPRGDQNNRDINGPIPGFALVNFIESWQAGEHVEIFAKVDNIFQRTYSTFGVLGSNALPRSGNTFDADPASRPANQFRSIGPGRGVWIGHTV